MLTLLLLAAELALTLADNTWQPANDKVPVGAQVRMDMDTGQKMWRAGRTGQVLHEAPAVDEEPSVAFDLARSASAAPGPQTAAALGRPLLLDDLDSMEEMAHDVDKGEEILQSHGASLAEAYADASAASARRESAGRILGVAVRNNPRAAAVLSEVAPALPSYLGEQRTLRALSILAGLATTREGRRYAHDALETVRSKAEELDDAAARKVDAIVRALAAGGEDVRLWGEAVQRALVVSHDDPTRYTLLVLLVDMVKRRDTFSESRAAPAVSPGFVAWLAEQAVRPRTSGSRFLQLVHQVRHSVFGNPKADRVHFDDL